LMRASIVISQCHMMRSSK